MLKPEHTPVPVVPTVRMAFAELPPEQRLAAIQSGVDTHRIELPEGRSAQDLHSDVAMWPVGRAMVLHSRFRSMIWERNEAHVQADRLDHIQISLTVAGQSNFCVPGHKTVLRSGSLIVIDYAYTSHGCFPDDLESITLTVPRHEFHRFAVDLSAVSGFEFTGANRAMIDAHFRALVCYLPIASVDEAERVVGSTVALVAACLPQLGDARRNVATGTSVESLRLFLEENALRRECNAEFAQKALGLSRSTLYRLAAPLGGVSSYVLRCRLERAAGMLRTNAGNLSVSRIGQVCGLPNASHFAQLFQRRFGQSPSQFATRNSVQADEIEHLPPTQHYAEMLGDVGGVPRATRLSAAHAEGSMP